MQFSRYDVGQLENIMRALRSGSFTFTGMEALAFSDCMKWASKLHKEMSDALIAEEEKVKRKEAKLQALQVKGSPFKEDPIKVESSEAPKLAKKK